MSNEEDDRSWEDLEWVDNVDMGHVAHICRSQWLLARSKLRDARLLGDETSSQQVAADAEDARQLYTEALRAVSEQRRNQDARDNRAREILELDAEIATLRVDVEQTQARIGTRQAAIAEAQARIGILQGALGSAATALPGHAGTTSSPLAQQHVSIPVVTIGTQMLICVDDDTLSEMPGVLDSVLEAGGSLVDAGAGSAHAHAHVPA